VTISGNVTYQAGMTLRFSTNIASAIFMTGSTGTIVGNLIFNTTNNGLGWRDCNERIYKCNFTE